MKRAIWNLGIEIILKHSFLNLTLPVHPKDYLKSRYVWIVLPDGVKEEQRRESVYKTTEMDQSRRNNDNIDGLPLYIWDKEKKHTTKKIRNPIRYRTNLMKSDEEKVVKSSG